MYMEGNHTDYSRDLRSAIEAEAKSQFYPTMKYRALSTELDIVNCIGMHETA